MIVFQPSQLKDSVREAIKEFSFLTGDIEDIDLDIFLDDESFSEYDCTITDNSKVCLYIGEDEYPQTSLRYFLYVSRNFESSKTNEKQSYAKSRNEVDFLLSINSHDTMALLDGLKESTNQIVQNTLEGTEYWHCQTTIKQKSYSVSLFRGLCIYHVLVEKSGNTDKYFPSYSDYDFFVRVECENDIDLEVADSLALSFVFELQATHNLAISFSEGRADPDAEYYDRNELTQRNLGIFPLIYGRGIKELLEIYCIARTTFDTDYKILSLTKVIEYISPTIAKMELYQNVLLKLKSPTVLAATSEYMNELGDIYFKHQNSINKDSELIKLAVYTVLELNEVWSILPNYIKPKKVERIDEMDETTKELCKENLVAAIYGTRNEIAHAKANYVKTGKECSSKEREQFSKVLDVIAVRCIRWFAMHPEEKREILSGTHSMRE